MAIRKILLPLSSAAAGESALATALVVARIWRAHVAALHVNVDSRDVAPLAGEGLSGAMIEEMMAATEKESGERAASVHALFDRAIAAQGIASAARAAGERTATASFTAAVGREEELVAQQARLADLTVVAHPDAGGDGASADALHAVLFDSGRPVLLAPQDAPSTIGRRVCVAWNGTAESASAVSAALPWLEKAEASCILSSEGYQRRGPPAEELCMASAPKSRCSVRWRAWSARACWRRPRSSAPTSSPWAPTRIPGCASSSWAASHATCSNLRGCRS
jgi:hypothetical protein